MSGRIARVDDLERYPISGQDGLTWRPVRRHFDIKSFGVNAYTAEEAGQRVGEDHREDGGHEELYVVISGRVMPAKNAAGNITASAIAWLAKLKYV